MPSRRYPPVLFLLIFFFAFPLPQIHAEPVKLSPLDPENPHIQSVSLLEHLQPTGTENASGGTLVLPGPLPSFVRVWWKQDPENSPLEFSFNKDASEVSIHLSAIEHESETVPTLQFLTTEKTTTHPDGTVVLSALDSEVVGEKAKLETHPGNHRIGFWGRAEDFVRWNATIPAGKFEVELVYSRASPTGTEVEILIAGTTLPLQLETTGSWYRYRNVSLGTVEITDTEKHRVEVRVAKIVNGGVMNLKALILTPVERNR